MRVWEAAVDMRSDVKVDDMLRKDSCPDCVVFLEPKKACLV